MLLSLILFFRTLPTDPLLSGHIWWSHVAWSARNIWLINRWSFIWVWFVLCCHLIGTAWGRCELRSAFKVHFVFNWSFLRLNPSLSSYLIWCLIIFLYTRVREEVPNRTRYRVSFSKFLGNSGLFGPQVVSNLGLRGLREVQSPVGVLFSELFKH
jgi:hypothetical protein